ncbi:MAG: S41 family peptidase [Cyclobacteriaceae bacterium]
MAELKVSKCWFFIIALWLGACRPSTGAPGLTAEQVSSDLGQLRSELERYHPGYDWYTSLESLTDQFDEAIENAQTADDLTFFRLVRKLVAQVRCGHTRASMPEAQRLALESHVRFLPVSITFAEKAACIKGASQNSHGLEVGDQIVAISGRPVSEIVSKIFDHLSADGFNETLKYQLTARNFSYFFSLFVDSTVDQYQVALMRKDIRFSVELSGVSIHELLKINAQSRPDKVLELTENQEHHYLRISSFGSSTINQSGQDYYDFLSESFEEISESPKPLILDLRGNGGGDDLYGAKLISYLVDRPFRYFDKIEVTDAYSGYGTIQKTQGTRLMTSHDGLNVQQPSVKAFSDPLYVLIDGLSFSTCADVASVLKANKRGIMIGEETGGGSGGNTSGNSKSITLRHSGIRVNVPMWKYSTAPDPYRLFGRGVMPDVEIKSTVNKLRDGEDPVLDHALSLIGQSGGD